MYNLFFLDISNCIHLVLNLKLNNAMTTAVCSSAKLRINLQRSLIVAISWFHNFFFFLFKWVRLCPPQHLFFDKTINIFIYPLFNLVVHTLLHSYEPLYLLLWIVQLLSLFLLPLFLHPYFLIHIQHL